MVSAAKLPVATNVGAAKMADTMFGPSIKVVSATYTGDPLSAGIYSNGLSVTKGVAPSDSGVILSTGKAASFTNATGEANQTAATSYNSKGVDGDADLNALAGGKTFDGAIFKADFVPQGSVLTMQVTFSSEEYLEYVGSGFNDAVGIWVNGEKAQLTVGDGDISIDNINPTTNGNLYVDNANDEYNTEMDGFTVTLTLKAEVKPGEVNSIKIGIADGGDASYDSNLMIVADSIQTEVVTEDDTVSLKLGETTKVDLLANDQDASGGKLVITKINGVPVQAGSQITLPNGVDVILGADGTITVVADANDTQGEFAFSYEVKNAGGVTDVGFVQGEVLPCFVEGTRILTERGLVPVERIVPGDRVVTLDHGPQPVLWHGRRAAVSAGKTGCVRIPAGRFGDHGALAVSPQHRLHVAGWRAELHSGAEEVLVRAIHLVRAGVLAQDQSGRPVVYHHLLFARHEIICAEGLWSESYHPGPATMAGHDPDVRAEILALFPALAEDGAAGYGPPARPEVCARVAELVLPVLPPQPPQPPFRRAGVSPAEVR